MVLKLKIQTLSSDIPTNICLYRAPMELKIVECYKQGFCIVIVEFEVCDERPGFLLNNKNDKIEYITREFIMNIASNKGGLNSDGSPNEASMFFSEKVLLTPRQLRRKTKN